MKRAKKQEGTLPADPDKLIALAAQGAQGAFEELYKTLGPGVYAYALSVLKNSEDANDLLQDCFISLYDSLDRYIPTGKAQGYVMAIAHHLCLMKLRQRKKSADLPEEDWMPLLEDHSLSPFERVLLRECMTSLSEEERQIFILHTLSGLKHREIGKLLDLPLSTVLSKYNRAIKKLQKKFG